MYIYSLPLLNLKSATKVHKELECYTTNVKLTNLIVVAQAYQAKKDRFI